ncbi:hypothetical protein D9M70_469540 [compost metagenome]
MAPGVKTAPMRPAWRFPLPYKTAKNYHGTAPDFRARHVAGAPPTPPGGRHRPWHHQLAGGRGAQQHPRGAGRRARPRAVAFGGALPAGPYRAYRLPGPGRSGARSQEHHRLGQALHGPRPARRGQYRAQPVRLRRCAGHGADQDRRGREEPGGNLGRNPGHAAPARRRHAGRRPGRRGHHRAGIFR